MTQSSADGMVTGARLAVRRSRRSGVELAFGLPGVHNLALWRALGDSPIRLVGVRHEQTAAYAADGYARASGKLGVALTTTGPGAANTLAAVGEAWACRQPVLVIATDVPTEVRRPGVWRGALHEATDQAAMFEPVVKRTFRVRAAEDVGAVIADAARVALEAPSRPVYVEIPTDLLSTHVPAAAEPPSTRSHDPGRAAARRRGGRGARQGRAAADLGRRRGAAVRRRRGRRGARRAARGARDHDLLRPRAARRPATPAWSTRRRTCRPPARSGTRPTSCSRSAATSTA